MERIACALFIMSSLAAMSALPSKFGMPFSCTGLDYCTERHPLYPQELVNRLLHQSNITFTNSQPKKEPSFINREEERDCEVFTTENLIYEIVDRAGDVRVVLQNEQDFRQMISIERCVKPGHIDYETIHFNLETVRMFNLHCVEQKLDFSFMVLTKDWMGIEMVKPKTGIPVGCDSMYFS